MDSQHMMVLETIRNVSSQNPNVLKPAEIQLSQWEIQPGFYTVLLDIIADNSIDSIIRCMATLYFKNGVDKYWRKNAPNAISDAEKHTIKSRVLIVFQEPINQIAIQLAVIIAKIARFDCPADWPEIIPALVRGIETNMPLVQHRALLTLQHTVKMLASKRLTNDRRMFQELSANIYNFVLQLWNFYTDEFVNVIDEEPTSELLAEKLDKALISLRVLRKLTVKGVRIKQSMEAQMFLKSIFERMKVALERRKKILNHAQPLILCEKYIIQLTKILTDVLTFHALCYVDYIQLTFESAVFYLFTDDGVTYLFERFIIQYFNLIKGVLLSNEYKYIDKAPYKYSDTDLEIIERANRVKREFFTAPVLRDVCEKMVTGYLALKNEDLETWMDDAEGFATDEAGESWKYSLRPCAETLFTTICHEFRDDLMPVILTMIDQSRQINKYTNDLDVILRKDAVYNAVGLTCYDLCDLFNFDDWFVDDLIKELDVKSPNYTILRKRVTWLIGVWINVKFANHLRPILYGKLSELLQPTENIAVRLSAAYTLKNAFDSYDFEPSQFQQYLQATCGWLFVLLKESRECDTKMQVLNIMSMLVEKMDEEMEAHAQSLANYLPVLWNDSEEFPMLRCAIVTALVRLIKRFNARHELLVDFLIPVITYGTDLKSDARIYLQEDCLNLWLIILKMATDISDDLMHMCHTLAHLLEASGTEHLRVLIGICQAYVLLAPEQFTRAYMPQIARVCMSMVSDLQPDGVNVIMTFFELSLRTNAGLIVVDVLKEALPKIIERVCTPSEVYESPMSISYQLAVISRVILLSADTFAASINHVAAEQHAQPEQVFKSFIAVWLNIARNICAVERVKLLALALTSLITAHNSVIFQCLTTVITRILEAINDVTPIEDLRFNLSGDVGFGLTDDVILNDAVYLDADTHTDDDTAHDIRTRALTQFDPVYTLNMTECFRQKFTELQHQVDANTLSQVCEKLEPELGEQLHALLRNARRESFN